MFAKPLQTVPEGVGAFSRERTFGPFFPSIVFKSQPECALGESWGEAGAKVSLSSAEAVAASRRRRSVLSLPAVWEESF